MKRAFGTIVSITILYIIGYTLREKDKRQPFYGDWKNSSNTLQFKMYGVCKINDLIGYMNTYEVVEYENETHYILHVHMKNIGKMELDIKIKDDLLYYGYDAYYRINNG